MLRGLVRAHSGAGQSSLRCVWRVHTAARSRATCTREHGGRRRAVCCAHSLGRAAPLREATAPERVERRCGARPARRGDRRWCAHGRKRRLRCSTCAQGRLPTSPIRRVRRRCSSGRARGDGAVMIGLTGAPSGRSGGAARGEGGGEGSERLARLRVGAREGNAFGGGA
eukprot:632615-Pleurochrysis_carterae.AAC.1